MSEFSREEISNIISALSEIETKPPANSPEEFKSWLDEYRVDDDYDYLSGSGPSISSFYGGKTADKTYDLWKYQVRCLELQDYEQSIIKDAIRRSLKGEALHIVRRLGPEASVSDIIQRMDSIYGLVDSQESILGDFYTAKQEDYEDVAAWGCRLEEILNKARQVGKVRKEDVNSMLTSKFFNGLKPALKDVARYQKDKIEQFDELLRAIRQIEKEHNICPSKRNLQESKLQTAELKIKQLKATIQQLNGRLKSLEENVILNYDETNADYRCTNYQQQEKRCWRCNQLGHLARSCNIRLDHRKRGQLYQQMYTTKDALGISRKQFNNMIARKDNSEVVGEATETSVIVNGMKAEALLDTGSTVSTLSQRFYEQHLSETPIESLNHLLSIECADGKELPYLGYITADLTVPGLPSETIHDAVFLIVPTSKYHSQVPVLLGTNVLSVLMKSTKQIHGQRFLQEANLRTPWYLAFRCISMREKDLNKTNNRLAVIRSAEKDKIIMKPNSKRTVQGYLDGKLDYQPVCAILQSSSLAQISDDIDVTPTVITYKEQFSQPVSVQLSNVTTRTVVIEPKMILCEIQPVSIVEMPDESTDVLAALDDVKISSTLNATQRQQVKTFLHQFKDIFSTGDTDIGLTSAVKHRIDLLDNIPFKQRHRKIPPSMIQEVKDHLQQLLAAGVIRRSHSPWSSNVVLCRKKDGKLRMCIDYRQLNQRTILDSYALPISYTT